MSLAAVNTPIALRFLNLIVMYWPIDSGNLAALDHKPYGDTDMFAFTVTLADGSSLSGYSLSGIGSADDLTSVLQTLHPDWACIMVRAL